MIGVTHYLVVAAILFTLGVLGIFLNRRNIILMLMAIELILLAVNINLVAFSAFLGDLVGQVFAMLSLAGIPPLFGFWPKLMVFNAAVAEGLYPLAVAGILGTVVGAFYYLKIVKVMYFDPPGQPFAKGGNAVETVLIGLAALFVSPLGYLLIGPLGQLSRNAAGSLF